MNLEADALEAVHVVVDTEVAALKLKTRGAMRLILLLVAWIATAPLAR